MKRILTFLIVLLAASAHAQPQYAELVKLERNGNTWTVQADYVDLVTPQEAIKRNAIRAVDARQYKMVFSNQNPRLRQLSLRPDAKISLLTFPNLTAKTATIPNLKQMLEGSEALPSEYEVGKVFALQLRGDTITGIEQVNTRAVTGVFEQAVLISRQTTFKPLKLVLDFVNAYTTDREMRRDGKTMEDNPAGLMISNRSPELRRFEFSRQGRIRLLKDASEYGEFTVAQLEAGLNGQRFGWVFDWDTYFYATISDVTGEVLELRQGYLP